MLSGVGRSGDSNCSKMPEGERGSLLKCKLIREEL